MACGARRIESEEMRLPAPGGDRAHARECRGARRTRRALAAANLFRAGDLARLYAARTIHRSVSAPRRAGWLARSDEGKSAARGARSSAGKRALQSGDPAAHSVCGSRAASRALRAERLSATQVLAVVNQKGGVGKTTT